MSAAFRACAPTVQGLRRWLAPSTLTARRPDIRTRASSNQQDKKTRVVRVAHILVNRDQGSLLDEIEAAYNGGEPFEELARKHSVCRSAPRGGELGWINPNTYFPEFELAAFSTPVGQSARATTMRGHHLLKVLQERRQSVVRQLSVEEVAELLSNPGLREDVQLVDVREQWEYDTARLPGFRLMPLSQFEQWSGSVDQLLDPAKETLVLCHHGVRSMQMAGFLVSQGFEDVKNISGGIDAYSRIDRSVPIY